MFKTLRWVVAGLALQLMVGQAFAQGGGRGGAGGASGVMLVQQKSVQDELKLSEDQIEKLKQVSAKMRESFGGGGGGGDREEARKKFEEARQAADKDIHAILTADQAKRLKEVVLQQVGPTALARPELAKEIGLTDDQTAKIKEITDALTTETRGQFQAGGGGDREEARKKMATLRKETGDKVLAVLKDDQKKAWEKLVGEPFKGEIQPFGGNRPRNKTAQ